MPLLRPLLALILAAVEDHARAGGAHLGSREPHRVE